MSNFRKPGVTNGSAVSKAGHAHAFGPQPPDLRRTTTGTGLSQEDALALEELGLDLTQIALDFAGVVDPTPVSDGLSALIALGRGKWLDAAISGASLVPYIGDLAKAGKLPGYLKTIQRAVELAERSPQALARLRPGLENIAKALDLLPAKANVSLEAMRQALKRLLRAETVAPKPDIRHHFQFKEYIAPTGNSYKTASGRLGVPSKVKKFRDEAAQKRLSGGTGDDAGHLIASDFGAPGGGENLSLQNWRSNEAGGKYQRTSRRGPSEHIDEMPSDALLGAYYRLEEEWRKLLEDGWGIEVTVTDKIRRGESIQRPFVREVEWTEISPLGERSTQKRSFSNPESPMSRKAKNIPLKVDKPQQDNVYDIFTKKKLP
jgi:hypothetical protein